jgi:gas vesicle protein
MFAACHCQYSLESTNALVARRATRRAIATPNPFLSTGIANQEEEIMKITSSIVALLTAGTLAVFGQEGTVQDIKHDAKKAGEKIKEGVETVGEKTKQAAETVGEKTKETAETVGRKTKETVETVGEKTNEHTTAAHHKSTKTAKKTKAEAGEERSSNRESNTPSPTDH